MRFNNLVKHLLSESLDNPYDYKWSERDGGFIFFPDPNNQRILYTVLMLEDPDYTPRLNIIFTYTDEVKNIQGTTDMTGTGDQFRIMATVTKIVKEYFNSHDQNKYEIIRFEAKSSERGKVALYKRLAHKLIDEVLGQVWDLDVFRTKKKVTNTPNQTSNVENTTDSSPVIFELSKRHSAS